jgi:hypothetical protein
MRSFVEAYYFKSLFKLRIPALMFSLFSIPGTRNKSVAILARHETGHVGRLRSHNIGYFKPSLLIKNSTRPGQLVQNMGEKLDLVLSPNFVARKCLRCFTRQTFLAYKNITVQTEKLGKITRPPEFSNSGCLIGRQEELGHTLSLISQRKNFPSMTPSTRMMRAA